MDVLYYSNYCPNSQKVLQYVSKNGLTEKLNCICIDKRSRDPNTGQISVQLENGRKLLMPPNVHSVPALLLVKKNYNAIFGGEIITHLAPSVKSSMPDSLQINGEPMGISLSSSSGGTNIVSEQYTLYGALPEELSAKGNGTSRAMYNYVSANIDGFSIPTPPDTYRPDKVSQSVTLDSLQQIRDTDIPQQIASANGMSNPYGI